MELLLDSEDIIDFIMSFAPPRRRPAPSGWEPMNCVMCHLNGEPTIDRKFKAGIIRTHDSIAYKCFRCGFKTGWKLGYVLPKNMRLLMSEWGADIADINLCVLSTRRLLNDFEINENDDFDKQIKTIKKFDLPSGAKPILEWLDDGCRDVNFINVTKHLIGRAITVQLYRDFYWTPELCGTSMMNKRIIIPLRRSNNIVGYIARLTSGLQKLPKYITKRDNSMLFNENLLYNDHIKNLIVVEGVFDAISVSGVGCLSNSLTVEQIKKLKNSNKNIIIVPDRDEAGRKLVEDAIDNGFSVSFPDWGDDIKDAEESARKNGVLWTIEEIIRKSKKSSNLSLTKYRTWHNKYKKNKEVY